MPAMPKVKKSSRGGVSQAVSISSDVVRNLDRVAAKKETPNKFV
jgi:hypothetical protein